MPVELRNPKKGLINVKNNNYKFFSWWHIKHINPIKIHPETVTQKDKELANVLDYSNFKFPVPKKDFDKLETKNNISINVFLL